MKKTLFLIVSLFFLTSSYSQIQFGLKGGLNLATVRYINTDNSKARLGWNAGALAEIPIQDNLLIRPEVQYSSKGFGFSAIGTASAGSVRLNYVAVPVLFGYRFNSKTELLLGPEFGFLRKAVSKSSGITEDMSNFYRHFDVGFDLGLAYRITKVFGAEVRYNYGFKDLVNVVYMNENGGTTGQGKNGANSVLQVGLFYMLN
jgi:hypothetical protein